ncbi:MAG: imidazole glycerol phosphate synthase cyclase subunit [Gammaproteobacteria bacterium]|nr:imidazole glycerol phosphate synthase cyclase subunit [Gammaproteobacteria bacterium]
MTFTHLKKRIIPKLLIRHRNIGSSVRPVLVTTNQYKDVYDVGDPVSQAKIYEAQMADELIVLNINSTSTSISDDPLMLDLIEQLASETFMPIAVGGSIRNLSDIACLLEHGADKVCMNASAISNPALITEAANRFGTQCLVVSIDFCRNENNQMIVFSKQDACSKEMDVLTWVQHVVEAGAGEILLTDVDRDGTGQGLNCMMSRAVTDLISVPVILSGGCGLAEHFIAGFEDGGAEAIAAGTFFCFRDQNPMQTRAQIRNAGIQIRMET